jgi:drug/metabolite transporter (DMT)-like permease
MSQVVRNANRVATTINVVKIVLLAFNAIAGVILVVNGAVGSQQQSINSLTGEIETSHAAAIYLIIGGLATLGAGIVAHLCIARLVRACTAHPRGAGGEHPTRNGWHAGPAADREHRPSLLTGDIGRGL